MISPTTNTCPNTLPYPYDVHSWAEYAFYFVIIFKYVSEKNSDIRPIPSILDTALAMYLDPHANITRGNPVHYRTTVRQWSKTLILRHWISRTVQLHGMHNEQNLTPVDFLHEVPCLYRRNWPCIVIILRNIFEDNYEIKRIFSPRVNVIGIR
ncbi:hypothetical protein SFRURICE_003564, partial [Spodoptera frugiperda]